MKLNVKFLDISWITFYLLIIFSWLCVALMSQGSAEIDSFQKIYGAEFWEELCKSPKGFQDWFPLILMWLVMSFAMMAPTILPSLKTFSELILSGASRKSSFFILISGFLLVWAGYSFMAATVQAALLEVAILNENGALANPILAVPLLILAGLYQFTPLKNACVRKCRSPLNFFIQHWSEGIIPTFHMGLRLGYVCVGCCWALMALAFVGGVMNFVFMGLFTLLMIFEKLPQLGSFFTKPVGYALIGVAFLYLFQIV